METTIVYRDYIGLIMENRMETIGIIGFIFLPIVLLAKSW